MLSSAANHHLPAFAAAGHLRAVTDLELQFHLSQEFAFEIA
jgi:hypothetical protein